MSNCHDVAITEQILLRKNAPVLWGMYIDPPFEVPQKAPSKSFPTEFVAVKTRQSIQWTPRYTLE